MIEADGKNRLHRKRGPGLARLFLVAAGVLLAAVTAACAFRPSATPGRTPLPASPSLQTMIVATSDSGASTTPSEPAALADLSIQRMNVQIQTGGACDYDSTELGVRVIVANEGSGDAGLFAVEVNGRRQSLAGLAPGARVELWFAGYVQQGENVAVVDAASQVPEADETNNRLAERLPIPTLPPTCTPAPAGSTPGQTTQPPTSTPGTPATQPPSTPVPSRAPKTPSPSPCDTPPPTARPTVAAVVIRESTVTIATYPYAEFLTEGWNDTFNMPYQVLDRAAFDASRPTPRNATYHTLVMENEFLRLTFLPDLGGRLYEVFDKRTGHRVTYRNPVFKPSPWGPAEQGWWLAAGGIEWCLPVEEHGYEWGVPWVAGAHRDSHGVTITLRDTLAGDRLRAVIAVRLETGAASFTIRPRIENPSGRALPVKYWTNAMLAPGGRNSVTSRLRFVLPEAVSAVTVHSRGDDWLPGANERMSWPVQDGIDFSQLGNWHRWLGFFEDPAAGDFQGVYDEGYDEGMVRVFPSGVVRGAKVFGFGWADRIAPDNWTDDGSTYVEIHGGPAATFDDSVTLPAGGHLEWTETWYPVAGLGGLGYANAAAAVNLSAGAGQIEAAIAVTRRWTGQVVLAVDGAEVWRGRAVLAPGEAWRQSVPPSAPGAGRVRLRLEAEDGSVTVDYETTLTW